MPHKVVLVCPCCASPVDAVAGPDTQELTCISCEQVWSMVIDAHRLDTHSLT